MTRPEFVVYSRRGCHVCEQLIEDLLPLVRRRASVKVVDIDSDPALVAKYDIRVPVVTLDGRDICQYQLDRAAINDALGS